MYFTAIQGKGKIGFLNAYEIKDKLKGIGGKWHSSVNMWVVTTQDDISSIMSRINVDSLDYRVGNALDCTGEMDRILFS